MITKEYGKQVLICDCCGDKAPERFNDFQDAIDYKKANWRSKKVNGEWQEICPECARCEQ